MNIQQLKTIAQQHQIDATGMSKTEIIHQLQRQEGNFDCFASATDGECDQLDCLWREDCFKAAKA